MRQVLNFDLYVVTAEVPDWHIGHLEVALAAIEGGASAIQLRDKKKKPDELLLIAKQLAAITRKAGRTLIINDLPAIALAAGADGIHLGQEDLPLPEAKKMLSPEMIIGVSASNLEEALAADRGGADYLGIGPIFPTPSKDDAAPPMGLAVLAGICQAVTIPVVAIGGLTVDNIEAVIDAGAEGIAVISAVTGAPDMTAAVSELVKKIKRRKLRDDYNNR